MKASQSTSCCTALKDSEEEQAGNAKRIITQIPTKISFDFITGFFSFIALLPPPKPQNP
jgi:hypothetical protein